MQPFELCKKWNPTVKIACTPKRTVLVEGTEVHISDLLLSVEAAFVGSRVDIQNPTALDPRQPARSCFPSAAALHGVAQQGHWSWGHPAQQGVPLISNLCPEHPFISSWDFFLRTSLKYFPPSFPHFLLPCLVVCRLSFCSHASLAQSFLGIVLQNQSYPWY